MRRDDTLAGLTEDAFRQEVLMPLLEAMDYHDVEHYHGPDELGKDIVAWKEAKDGTREYVAIVAKAGNVGASVAGAAGIVANQVRQAFGSSFLDKKSGDTRQAHNVIVAASGTIKEKSQKAIRSLLDEHYQRHVKFWDGREVMKLIGRYMPERSIPKTLTDIHTTLLELASFSVTPVFGPDGLIFRIDAKEDGVIFANGVFSFPNSPEADAVRAELERFLDEGGSVTIPGQFIVSFSRHEELGRVFGNEKPAFLELRAPESRERNPIRIELLTPEGPLFYEGLTLQRVRAGRRRQEYRTQQSGEPLRLTIILNRLGPIQTEVRVNVSFHILGHSARRSQLAVRVWMALAAGGRLSITDLEGHPRLSQSVSFPVERPPQQLVQYLDDLAYIEQRLGWELTVPELPTYRDLLDGRELRQIIATGSYSERFQSYTATLVPERGLDILEVLPPGKPTWIKIIREGQGYEILGRTVELGTCRTTFQAKLSEEAHADIATQQQAGAEKISLKLDAMEEAAEVVHEYPKWMPGSFDTLEPAA